MFGIPLTTRLDNVLIKSTACRRCPELLECVPYALHKLQMTVITLNAEQCSAVDVIYNCQDVFVWL